METIPVLQMKEVSGGYNRNRPVIHDIGFEVLPGEMIGLIGLNGAGKSTIMKHILGLLQPHKGEIRLQGVELAEDTRTYREAYAYVPETPLLFDELTVQEHLELTARAYGIDKPEYERRKSALYNEFYMADKADTFSRHLSKGMRQKLMIMNAFLVQPSLYIIDEPFLGLDPLGIRSLLELMVKMKENGASVFMSSHILSTIEKYCDRFIVLHKGRILAAGTLAEIGAAAGRPGEPLEECFYELIKDEPAKGGALQWK